MIRSFKSADTEKLFKLEPVRRFRSIGRSALRKLKMLDAANRLADLAALPGNRAEKLSGNHAGQYSIRINDQWRICFVWKETDAYAVEIVDYH